MNEEFKNEMKDEERTGSETVTDTVGNSQTDSSATTYSWVNPKISGKSADEDNSASYTGGNIQADSGENQNSGSFGSGSPMRNGDTDHGYHSAGSGQSTENQNAGSRTSANYQYQNVRTGYVPAAGTKKEKKKKSGQPMSTGKRWGTTLAMAVCFGLVAGLVFTGTAAAGQQFFGKAETTTNVTIPTTTTTAATGNNGSSGSTSSGMTVKDVANSAMPSLVAISTTTVEEVQTFFGTTSQEVPASGTGVIVGMNDTELLIATNNHVVSGAKELSVSFIDDTTIEAQIKGTDAENDLAVIAVKLSDIPEETQGNIKIAVMGNSDELEVGDQVVAIGNALGTGQSVTSGYVSAKDRTVSSQDEMTGETTTSEDLIQTDAAINPGNSGGALLNMNGELVGINEAKYSSTAVEGMGFAIPISKAEPILQDLMNLTTRYKVDDEKAAYIGISMADVSSDASLQYGIPTGVCIMDVVEGSPAAEAGIKKGDVITKFDGRGVSNSQGLKEILTYYEEGETVEVTVQRADDGEYKEQVLSLTLGSAKDMPQSTGGENNSGKSVNPFGK